LPRNKINFEIDGESHNNQKDYDEERTKILIEYGYKVIRFSNDEVNTNATKVELKLLSIVHN
jgi:very-short-patch-repair endonuclease